MVMVDHIKKINVTILRKIGMKGYAKHPKIIPGADLIADVDHGSRQSCVVLKNPDAASPFPGIHSARPVEKQAHHSVPIAAPIGAAKTRGEGGGASDTNREKGQAPDGKRKSE